MIESTTRPRIRAWRFPRHLWSRPRGWLSVLGPGLVTGASDDDPSGIATYSQVGAAFGFAMCWVMLFTYPLMAAIQEISARIGRVTGLGIAGNIRAHYPRWVSQLIVSLLLIANILNLGAEFFAPDRLCRRHRRGARYHDHALLFLLAILAGGGGRTYRSRCAQPD